MEQSEHRSRTRCPIVLSDAKWIEERWKWLEKTFGKKQVCQSQVVLPVEQYFPDQFKGDLESAEKMLQRLADYMMVSAANLQLTVFVESKPNESYVRGAFTAAGLYWTEEGLPRIGVEESNLANPTQLAATLAHELGHVRLLGDEFVSEDEEDHEPLTDLFTVWCGLGVMTSNAVLQEDAWSTGLTFQWRASTRGYLSMQMYGYALACFAATRGEVRPEWIKHLRPDVRKAFEDSVVYRSAFGSRAGLDEAPLTEDGENSLIEKPKQVLFLRSGVSREDETTDQADDSEMITDESTMTTDMFRSELDGGRRSFRNLTMPRLDLSELDLSGCDFSGSDLSETDFTNTNLSNAILRDCELPDSILYAAVLENADLRSASFRRSNLSSAILQGADVRSTDFRACDVSFADFTSCRFDRQTNLVGAATHNSRFDSAFRHTVLGEPGALAQSIMSSFPALLRPLVSVAVILLSITAMMDKQKTPGTRVVIGVAALIIATFLMRKRPQ